MTPTYYVMFTFCTLVTSVILYEGLKASASQIITIVLGFFVICTGIFILQMSKVDPRTLSKLDRKTTILLQAARSEIRPYREDADGETDEEKTIEATEEPGVDALAGRFGAIGGTVVRARRRATIQGAANRRRKRAGTGASTQTAQSDRSIGMDTIQAQELHDHWREEKRLESGGVVSERPVGIDGLPVTPSTVATPNGNANNGNGLLRHDMLGAPHFLSNQSLVSSPMGTPSGVIVRTPSVHFRDQQSPSSTRLRPDMPTVPPAALVPTSNTSLPSLNLPTPSLQIGNPLRGEEETGDSKTTAKAAKPEDRR